MSRLSDIFTKNGLLKLLALGAALVLWVYVSYTGYRTDTFPQSLTMSARNGGDGLVATIEPQTMKVRVRVPSASWTELAGSDFEAYVDLANMREGSYDLEPRVSMLRSDTELVSKDPVKVRVTLEQRKSKTMSASFSVSGSPAAGYTAGTPTSAMGDVTISGGSGTLDKVVAVKGEAKLTGNEMSEQKQMVTLRAFDNTNNEVSTLTLDPATVEVTVPIQKEQNVKTVSVKIITKNAAPNGLVIESVTADPQTVALEGSQSVLANITTIDTDAIDLSKMSGNTTLTLSLSVPQNTKVLGDTSVRVTVTTSRAQTSRSIGIQVSTKNLGSTLAVASLSPSVAYVTIEGSADTINALKADQLKAVLDLSGKGKGTYDISLAVSAITAPTGVTVKSVDTKTIKVVIEQK